ncbi:MAG: hypothetical protein JXB05_03870 [Myxococcaceae bacterium]|nr:hypothetical protein [Myxococcaceae bacterium]
MRPLSASDIIRLWDAGQSQHPLDRALGLLGAGWPELTRGELAAMDVGERDARLLRLRELMAGPVLECFAECPTCHAPLEFRIATSSLLPAVAPPPRGLEAAGVAVQYRLPDSRDLAAVARCADAEAARRLLLRRCVLSVREGQDVLSADALSAEVVAALCARIEEEASATDVRMNLTCPACSHRWQVAVDVAEFFWQELAAEARRLLREVHLLARAYSWSEESILAMGPQRRQYYLELAGQ